MVTAGHESQAHIDALQAAGEYAEAYFAHGMAIAATEGLAEALHRRVKRELGIGARARAAATPGATRPAPTSSTTRWSATCWAPQEAIGVGLTSAFQLDPEQSTAAIVVHHPSAIYFSALRSERATA